MERGRYFRRTLSFERAPTDRIDAHRARLANLMNLIADLRPGQYLVTDESTLTDFAELPDFDTEPLWRAIEERHGIERADVHSDFLVDILDAIAAREHPQ